MSYVVPTFLTAGMICSLLILVRNEWTSRAMRFYLDEVSLRSKQDIQAGREWRWRYDTLPDYDAVLLRFWVWDREAFRPAGAR